MSDHAQKQRGFDRLAPVYDALAGIVFGTHIRAIQTWLVRKIPDHAEVLIAGGGTGWILEIMAHFAPTCRVHFLDFSSEMIRRAKARSTGNLRVEYQVGEVFDLDSNLRFDVVITPFFLDLFAPGNLLPVMDRLDQHLKPEGLWLQADFQEAPGIFRPFSSILIKLMYRFFRATTGISARSLPDFRHAFMRLAYVEKARDTRFRGMIVGQVFEKDWEETIME